MKVELVGCVETRCKRQDGLLMEQGERIRSLKADRNQVGPVSLNEVRGLHDAGVCMPSVRSECQVRLLIGHILPIFKHLTHLTIQ